MSTAESGTNDACSHGQGTEFERDQRRVMLVRLYLGRSRFDDARRIADEVKNLPLFNQLMTEVEGAVQAAAAPDHHHPTQG